MSRNRCDGCDESGPIKLSAAEVLPAPQQTLRHLLGVQREHQVITPVAVDVQIARPQPLRPEAQLGHHPQAAVVLRPDRDLDPVQAHHAEAVVDGQRHRGRDDAPAGEPLVDPVADLPPGRRPADDAAHRQLAGQCRLGLALGRVDRRPARAASGRPWPVGSSERTRPAYVAGPGSAARRQRGLPGPQPGRRSAAAPAPRPPGPGAATAPAPPGRAAGSPASGAARTAGARRAGRRLLQAATGSCSVVPAPQLTDGVPQHRASTAIPSRAPPRRARQVEIKVRPATPATPRLSTAVGTP